MLYLRITMNISHRLSTCCSIVALSTQTSMHLLIQLLKILLTNHLYVALVLLRPKSMALQQNLIQGLGFKKLLSPGLLQQKNLIVLEKGIHKTHILIPYGSVYQPINGRKRKVGFGVDFIDIGEINTYLPLINWHGYHHNIRNSIRIRDLQDKSYSQQFINFLSCSVDCYNREFLILLFCRLSFKIHPQRMIDNGQVDSWHVYC